MNENPAANHSSMIIGGLAAVALSLFGGDHFQFNPHDGSLWAGVGLALHGFGVNVPILDNILGMVGGLFAKK